MPGKLHRILEFGGGTGSLVGSLSGKLSQDGVLFGIDPDGSRVRIAEENLHSDVKDKVVFLEASDANFVSTF